MSAAPRLRSRRRPTLRVVAGALDTTRHARLWSNDITLTPYVIEVWTFAEWDRMPERERPEWYDILPGIGFLAVRKPHGRLEQEDIKDVCRQAWAAFRTERGLD